MIRRPPRSTLFPTRRSSDLAVDQHSTANHAVLTTEKAAVWLARPASGDGRSEEHTSELQSQSNIVCRPLLEKKKSLIGCRTGTSVSFKQLLQLLKSHERDSH